MELNEKIQELRKQKGLTQEELAQALYVSRTAVSKWESGRGYPNLDSLKLLANFFSVTIDDLLSGDELLAVAQESCRQTKRHLLDLIFGSLDFCGLILLFLPFFRQPSGDIIKAVPLLSLTEISPYLKCVYWGFVIGITVLGILTLTLQNNDSAGWAKVKRPLSLSFSVTGILSFILSSHPYAAIYLFLLAAIKVFLLLKKT